jgi:opacity protein-like surface antigen
MMRAFTLFAATAVALAPAATFAAPTQTPPSSGDISPPVVPNQPNQDCETLGNQPGNSMNNNGSAFSPTGQSGTVYAGEQKNVNDKNTVSVSQYDQACAVNQSPQQ